MPRYSLSPIPTYGSKFNYDDSDDDYDDNDSEQTEILIRNDECVSHANDDYIDEEDEEEDYPHPIGFGKTRFGFYDRTTDTIDTTSSNELISMNAMNTNTNSNNNSDSDIGFMSRYHLNVPRYQCQLQNAKQTKALLLSQSQHNTYNLQQSKLNDKNEDSLYQLDLDTIHTNMDRIAAIVRNSTSSFSSSSSSVTTSNSTTESNSLLSKIKQASIDYKTKSNQSISELNIYKQKLKEQQQIHAYNLLLTIKKDEVEGDYIIQQEQEENEIQRMEEQRQKKLKEQKEQEKQLELQKQQQEQEFQKRQKEQEEKLHQQHLLEEETKKQNEIQQEKELQDQEAKQHAEKYAYLTKANEYIQRLIDFRETLEPFEKHTDANVKKRRLQMKKIARGKMNTLSHDKSKIENVTNDIVQAIQQSKTDDDGIKQQIQNGNNGYSREMARGTKYLMDLIASTVIVRIQAEGFNGTRGDGFPLAHMLAMSSTHLAKEFANTLMAHFYTVCPIAIPTLPTPSKGDDGEKLMESLGMQKGKNDEYETFDRFLARTEVRIMDRFFIYFRQQQFFN